IPLRKSKRKRQRNLSVPHQRTAPIPRCRVHPAPGFFARRGTSVQTSVLRRAGAPHVTRCALHFSFSRAHAPTARHRPNLRPIPKSAIMEVAIRAFCPENPTFSPVAPRSSAVNAVADALSVPRNSPLAKGWRAALVAMLAEHGLVDVLDTVSAFAELACRAEPDPTAHP